MVDLAGFFLRVARELLEELGLTCSELMNICPRWGLSRVKFPCPCYWLCSLAEKIATDLHVAEWEFTLAELLGGKVESKCIVSSELSHLALLHECLEGEATS